MIKIYSNKNCRYCNQIFTPITPNQHFCSLCCSAWSKIDISSPTECWEWKGAVARSGYGSVRKNEKVYQAHRVIYECKYGKIISSQFFVCHKCDNKTCCNPAHFFLGTMQDNIKDRDKKGRQADIRGSKNPHSKLTEEKVTKIKESLSFGISIIKLGIEYGVSFSNISKIKCGHTWKHI